MTVNEAPPVVPPVLFPHTLAPAAPPDPPVRKVDVDGLCDVFDRSSSAVLYIQAAMSPADAAALMDGHQLVAEFDAVRGGDAIRHATDDELAAAAPAKAASSA